jgi:pimeloyl-ACP methyl ester carboxylesterase
MSMIDISKLKVERGLVKTGAGYLHYRSLGQGEPILMFHINQQSSAVYLELMSVLSPKYRAIAVDYPSYGMSDHLDFQPTLSQYAQWMVELMDGLGLKKAHVLGEATGAALCVELAARFPERVNKVVMVNCPIYLGKSEADLAHMPLRSGGLLRPTDTSGFPLTRTIEFMLEKDPTHSPLRPSQSWMDRINVAQMETGRDRWQALDALHGFDSDTMLRKVKNPALLLFGEHFHYVQFTDEFKKRLQGLRVEVIPDARFCMAWEKAEEVGRLASEFLG